MNIHILGICGTFMAGIAILAKQKGCNVTGQDEYVYPPMSTQLAQQGIHLIEGYDPRDLPKDTNIVVIGNAMKRGNLVVEAILNNNIPYQSGPQWLYENVLHDRFVLAVAGTHGKTTTSSLLAWILEYAGLNPGFLIGGVPENFGLSARLGEAPFFVIEADEYDSAFFDKRSKFMHYHPRTLILNNLEFDHVDIFPNLAAIQQQFHHLVRTLPSSGLVIMPYADHSLEAVIQQGCWTPTKKFSLQDVNCDLTAKLSQADGSQFTIHADGNSVGHVTWPLLGQHNVNNALAAILAARHAGVLMPTVIEALSLFKNVKRRLEIRGCVNQITLYDDFAHHPTAIATTLAGLRAKIGNERMLAIVDFASHTMRLGVHADTIGQALQLADKTIFAKPKALTWQIEQTAQQMKMPACVLENVDEIIDEVVNWSQPGDHIVVMSNRDFEGIHTKLLEALQGTCRFPG